MKQLYALLVVLIVRLGPAMSAVTAIRQTGIRPTLHHLRNEAGLQTRAHHATDMPTSGLEGSRRKILALTGQDARVSPSDFPYDAFLHTVTGTSWYWVSLSCLFIPIQLSMHM